MSWFYPKPPVDSLILPRRLPKIGVPSFIKENGQVLNLLMHHGSGGVVRDYSGFANNGSIFEAVWRDGIWGWGLYFDGVDDSVDAGLALSLDVPASDFTIESWVNPNNALALQAIIGKIRLTTHSWGLYQLGGKFQFQFRGAGLGVDTTADNVYTVGTWYHVVATRTVNTNNLYINSVVQADVDVTADIPVTAAFNFYIGRRVQDNLFNFNGLVGGSRLSNRSLSQPEISHHFESTRTIYGV